MAALDEILAEEGGMALNQPLALHLFQQLRLLNEWGQSVVMGVLARYAPTNEDEIFNVLVRRSFFLPSYWVYILQLNGGCAATVFVRTQNILDDRLKHASGVVVLAAVRLFLQYTAGLDENIVHDVYMRIKGATALGPADFTGLVRRC